MCRICLMLFKIYIYFLFFFYFFFKVYLFFGQRETEHERGRGRERGLHGIGNRLQALSHQPRARRGARTHGPRDRDLAEVGRLPTAPPRRPYIYFLMRKLNLINSLLQKHLCHCYVGCNVTNMLNYIIIMSFG